eukprot:10486231-Prorocentrum_lima.AAC.1
MHWVQEHRHDVKGHNIFWAFTDSHVPLFITKPIGLEQECKGSPSKSGKRAISYVLSGRVPKSLHGAGSWD